MRVLIVGQNPSTHNLTPHVPFKGSSSGRTLDRWLAQLGLDGSVVIIVNASDVVGRRPRISELRQDITWFCYDKIVALGELASRSLLLSGCPFQRYFRLPHPSGLNRKLNDKKRLAEQLEACYHYIHEKRLT